MYLTEIFNRLCEDTPQQIKKRYNNQIINKWAELNGEEIPDSGQVVELMASMTPDGATNTYMAWIYKNWMGNKFELDQESIAKIKSYLTVFEKGRKSNKTSKKDPLQYSFEELMGEAGELKKEHDEKEREKQERKQEVQRVQDEGEVRTAYEDKEIQILQPTSFQACRLFGREGSWCVSTDQHHWDSYADRGDFYIINIKPNKKEGVKKQKYGVHIEGGEWQNEQNERISDEEISDLVERYPAIRDVLNDEAEEHGFEPVLGVDWVSENPRKYAEKAVQRWEDSEDGNYGFDGIPEITYQQDQEWDKEFTEEVARITDTDTAIPLLRACGIHSDILVDEAIDKGFNDDFFRVMEEEYGLSDNDYAKIYKQNPDLISDALSYQSLNIETLYSELDRDLFNDMLRNNEYIAEYFFEPYEEEYINDPEDGDLVQSLLNAMSSSGDNYERGLEALENLGDVGVEIKEAWENELMQVRKDVMGKKDGLSAIMSRGEEVSKEDILNSLTQNPQNLHVLERNKIPITHDVAKYAIIGDPNYAVEWLFMKGYTISSELAQLALNGWEQGRSSEKIENRLHEIASNTDMF